MAKSSGITIDERGYIRNGDGGLTSRDIAKKYIYLPNKEKFQEEFTKYVVHHRDMGKFNNSIKNLLILKQEQHHRIHYGGMTKKEYRRILKMNNKPIDKLARKEMKNMPSSNEVKPEPKETTTKTYEGKKLLYILTFFIVILLIILSFLIFPRNDMGVQDATPENVPTTIQTTNIPTPPISEPVCNTRKILVVNVKEGGERTICHPSNELLFGDIKRYCQNLCDSNNMPMTTIHKQNDDPTLFRCGCGAVIDYDMHI